MLIWIWPVIFLICAVLSVESEQPPPKDENVTLDERGISSSSATKVLTEAQMTMAKMKLEISKTKQEEIVKYGPIRTISRKKTWANKTVDSVVTEFWEQRSNRINKTSSPRESPTTTSTAASTTTVPGVKTTVVTSLTTQNATYDGTNSSPPTFLVDTTKLTSDNALTTVVPPVINAFENAELPRNSAKQQRQDADRVRDMVDVIRAKYKE